MSKQEIEIAGQLLKSSQMCVQIILVSSLDSSVVFKAISELQYTVTMRVKQVIATLTCHMVSYTKPSAKAYQGVFGKE